MANPRKFSEKIALHTQKQAEETAAFEQILRDVQSVTASTTAPQQVGFDVSAKTNLYLHNFIFVLLNF